MKKEFIPYQEAKDLKELGFNEKCAAHYLDEDDLELKWEIYRNLSFNTDNCVQAPLYQQAFRFFRENYGCTYSIGWLNDVVIHFSLNPSSFSSTTFVLQKNKTYKDAEIACLKKLIELVKTK